MSQQLLPRKGALAYCLRGILGVIISDQPDLLGIKMRRRGAWRGIALSPHRLGKPWQSYKPRVIGYVDDISQAMVTLAEMRKIENPPLPHGYV